MATGNKFERITTLEPAYDLRDKDCGVGAVTLRMVLKGKEGAVQFVLYTGWYPKTATHIPDSMCKPQPADLGYHSPSPRYDGQDVIQEDCEYLNGKPCYYDGSGLNAYEAYDILLKKGSKGVWKFLEGYYNDIFIKSEVSDE